MREDTGRESDGRSVLECLDALDEPAIWVREGRIHACTGAARSLLRDIELEATLAEAFALSPARVDALKGGALVGARGGQVELRARAFGTALLVRIARPREGWLFEEIAKVAARLQGLTTADAVFEAVGEGLAAIDILSLGYDLRGEHVVYRHAAAPPRLLGLAEPLLAAARSRVMDPLSSHAEVEKVVREGRSRFLDDAASVRQDDPRLPHALRAAVAHAFILPIFEDERVSSVLIVAGERLRPSDEPAVRFLAAHLSNALELLQMQRRAAAHVDEVRHLLDVGRTIAGSLELKEVLAFACASLAEMIQASTAFAILLDEPTWTLRIVACSNPKVLERTRDLRMRLDATSMAAECVRTGRPVIVGDVANSTVVNPLMVEMLAERAAFAVPLIARDGAIGAILIDDRSGPRGWTRKEIEGATVIAQQLSVAVVNARLYEDLRASYGEISRAQEELVRAERLAALGEMAAVVAHEVRNPLAVITHAVGSLQRTARSGEDAPLLAMVGEEVERIGRIVRDLLDFARPGAPDLRRESFGEIIEGAVEAVMAAKLVEGVDVRVTVAADLPNIQVDRRLVHQALVNLVLNGVQAMPQGGRLDVTASRSDVTGKDALRVEVRDQGVGIEESTRARLFEPFFTTKPLGTGLGLAVVKRIAEAHGGSIHVAGAPGQGTTFALELPIAPR
jgi:signal transduction histidine kinase